MTQHASSPSEKIVRPKRWWKWIRRTILTLFMLVVVLLLMGWVYVEWANTQGDQAVAAVLDQLRQRQLPDSPEKLLAESEAAKRPPGRYLYAAAELAGNPPDDYDDLPFVGHAKGPDFGKPIPSDMARRVGEFVNDNKDYFALLDKAQAADERQELVTFDNESISQLSKTREAARRWGDASLAAQAAGDSDEAMQCCAKALWLGSTLDGQPSITDAMIRGGDDMLVVSGIEQCLSRGQATPESLHGAQEKLLHEEAAIDLPEITKGEVAVTAYRMKDIDLSLGSQTHMLTRALPAMEKSHRELDATLKSLGATGPTASDILGPEVSRDTIRGALAVQWAWAYICPGAYRQFYAAQVQRALTDLDRAAKPAEELAKWAAQASQADAKTQVGLTPRCVQMLLDIKASLRAASVALSVEQYRMAHGDWPTNLAAVKDGRVADPFTGLPFKYARTSQGVVVYSVGKNLSDDGGKGRGSGGDDLAFRLLNPTLRNKP